MARIAGVKMEHDTKGRPSSITINLKKHPKAIAALQNLGLFEKSKIQKALEAKTWVSPDELEQELISTVKEHYAGNNR